MILAVGGVYNEEFMARGLCAEEAYKHLQEITDISPQDVQFYKLEPYPVKCVITFEPI